MKLAASIAVVAGLCGIGTLMLSRNAAGAAWLSVASAGAIAIAGLALAALVSSAAGKRDRRTDVAGLPPVSMQAPDRQDTEAAIGVLKLFGTLSAAALVAAAVLSSVALVFGA